MSKNAVLCLLAAVLLTGLAALAQDTDSASTRSQTGGDSQTGSATPPASDEPVSDDVFIPSEEVQAAEELVFPVNI